MDSKKILVTGADVFKGSHLTKMLIEKGHSVEALYYYDSFNAGAGLEAFVTLIWKC